MFNNICPSITKFNPMGKESKYNLRGVSAKKEDVHKAIRDLDKGLFPLAFCKILPDIVGQEADFCNIMHADTAGTKTALAYLYWKETGNLDVWKGVAQDAIVMNLDDMACVGCVDQVVISSTIGRNKNLIPGEVIAAIINGTSGFIENLQKQDVHIHLSGRRNSGCRRHRSHGRRWYHGLWTDGAKKPHRQ